MLESLSKKQWGVVFLAAFAAIAQGGGVAYTLGSLTSMVLIALTAILAYNNWQRGRAEQA